ncbi:MAG: peptidylprolyl isomerase [Proteobacteria bacterium]|nr:peptidylprolyl isomerase [Pseudomonadota bacterium]
MSRHRHSQRATARGWIARAALTAAVVGLAACGVEERPAFQQKKPPPPPPPDVVVTPPPLQGPFPWPTDPGPVATLHIRERGPIRIALYPEIAPETVRMFRERSARGDYTGTTFHRVVPDFMIQGGDPNTRNRDPRDDGKGGRIQLVDEFTAAPHDRGTVSLANRGPGAPSAQFFIVQADAHHLNGRHALFGRVLSGMDIVDAIAAVEVDQYGRYGPEGRPLEDEVVERVELGQGDRIPEVGAAAN